MPEQTVGVHLYVCMDQNNSIFITIIGSIVCVWMLFFIVSVLI